jgi:hypothetical protein
MGNDCVKHILIYFYIVFFQYNKNEETLNIDCLFVQYKLVILNPRHFEKGKYELIFVYYN